MKIGKFFALTAALLMPNKTNEVEKKQMGDSGHSLDHVNQELYTKKSDGSEKVEKVNYYDPFEEKERAEALKKDVEEKAKEKSSVLVFGDSKASYFF